MRVARVMAPHVMRLDDAAMPVPGPGEALVRITAVGICGSDLQYYAQGRIGELEFGAGRERLRQRERALERDRHGLSAAYAATNGLGVCRLTSLRDRNNNQLTFQYNSLGQLTNVVDTLGRSIAYTYGGNGRLTQVTDFSGRTLQFAYDPDGNLTSVTSPAVTV